MNPDIKVPVDEPAPTPPQEIVKTEIKQKSKMPIVPLLVVLLILALGAVAFLVYQNMQLSKQIARMATNYQTSVAYQLPSPIPTSSPITETNIAVIKGGVFKSDGKGGILKNEPQKDFVMTTPDGFTYNSGLFTSSSEQYGVSVNSVAGLCPMVEDGSNCGYKDEPFNDAQVLRVWSDKNGVFALNLISIKIDDYFLDSIVLTKITPDKVFTNQQLVLWKNLLGKITLRTTN